MSAWPPPVPACEPAFGADRGHIHHRLLDRGFSPRRVALLLYAIGGLGALFSVLQSLIHGWLALLIPALFCIATALGFHLDLADKAERTLFVKDLAIAGALMVIAAGAWHA